MSYLSNKRKSGILTTDKDQGSSAKSSPMPDQTKTAQASKNNTSNTNRETVHTSLTVMAPGINSDSFFYDVDPN